MDFVKICNVCARKAIIKVAERKINSDKKCRSYSDLNFGVTFLEHSVECQQCVQNSGILVFVNTSSITMHYVTVRCWYHLRDDLLCVQ